MLNSSHFLMYFISSFRLFVCYGTADHGNGSQGEDYDESEEDDYDNDDDEDDHIGDRKPFPIFTPVTPYPPYSTYVFRCATFYMRFFFVRLVVLHRKLCFNLICF